MLQHTYITPALLVIAVALVLLSSIGLFAMRDPFQRLHYSAPIVLISSLLIVIAIWLEQPDWQARTKSVLIFLILSLTNSVLNHATARAIRIRDQNRWAPAPDEKIPVQYNKGIAGVSPFDFQEEPAE